MSCRKFILLVLPLALLNLSCQLTEPDPITIKGQSQPDVVPIVLSGIGSTAPLTGMITITLPDSIFVNVRRLAMFVDTLLYDDNIVESNPVHLDLTRLSNGVHILSFMAYDRNGYPGLLNLIVPPNRIYATAITVDNNPPAPVQNVTVRWNLHATITWQQSTDIRFRAYIVRRQLSGRSKSVADLDTIEDRTRSSFTDTTLVLLYGTSVGYSIGVSNGTQVTFAAPVITSEGGIDLPVTQCQYGFTSPRSDEFFIVTPDNNLISLWTQTNTVLRQINVAPDPTLVGATPLMMSPDGYRFYRVTEQFYKIQTLQIYDATPFTAPTSIHLVSPLWFYNNFTPGTGTILFFVDTTRTTRMLDISTGTISDSIAWVNYFVPKLQVTPDGRSLLLWSKTSNDGSTWQISRYDLSTGHPVFACNRTFSTAIDKVVCAPSGGKGAVILRRLGEWSIEIVDLATLGTLHAVRQPPGVVSANTFEDAVCSDQFLYTGFHFSEYTTIVEIDVATGMTTRSWNFEYYASPVATGRDGKYLYVFGSNSDFQSYGYGIPL